IESYRELLSQVCSGSLRELIAAHAQPAPIMSDGKPAWQPRPKVMFGAWVADVRFFKGDRNADSRAARPSYKVTLDDQTAQLSTWIDADRWARFQGFVKADVLVFVVAEI